ncbi:hypothetical protein Cgig2_028764 [Carnegiea gigantea]|uniref:Uncharacterized protein n=1 Tax=Carnegiea gigantea TaxID=171969 RepID=A0A9Q1JQH0_9CARY|nr:hypothetical protein Cgig2_028764 [Carnegiea gigantea]
MHSKNTAQESSEKTITDSHQQPSEETDDTVEETTYKMPPHGHIDESDSNDEVLVKIIKKIKEGTKSRPKKIHLDISLDKRIEITPMDVHITLELSIGGKTVEEFYGKKPEDATYNEVLDAWRKDWNLQDGTPKLSQMPQYILSQTDAGKSFKRNFVMYMINWFDKI